MSVFVFGSNLAGRHGKGSALEAVKRYGATPGIGVGPSGDSYAIPTKDGRLRVLALETIEPFIVHFIEYALAHPTKEFRIVDIGCGLAGYRPEEIAPLFKGAPANCLFIGKLHHLVER